MLYVAERRAGGSVENVDKDLKKAKTDFKMTMTVAVVSMLIMLILLA